MSFPLLPIIRRSPDHPIPSARLILAWDIRSLNQRGSTSALGSAPARILQRQKYCWRSPISSRFDFEIAPNFSAQPILPAAVAAPPDPNPGRYLPPIPPVTSPSGAGFNMGEVFISSHSITFGAPFCSLAEMLGGLSPAPF